MRIGICGYGNLGKAVEEIASIRSDFDVKVIFSRRSGLHSPFKTKFESLSSLSDYRGELDAVIMCGGSQEDLEWQSPKFLQEFSIIDSFDTHKRIPEHAEKLRRIAKQSGNVAIYSCGWDPGLFSVARTLFSNIVVGDSTTFWGKGVSQGHSEALRNVRGVADAIQYTIPDDKIMQEVRNNPDYKPDANKMHRRECYIALTGERPIGEIAEEVLQMPNYFKDQRVSVQKATYSEIEEMKKNMGHEGVVLSGDQNFQMELSAKMKSNPMFTAHIMLAYAKTIPMLSPGAYSVLDIPPGLVGGNLQENNKNL